MAEDRSERKPGHYRLKGIKRITVPCMPEEYDLIKAAAEYERRPLGEFLLLLGLDAGRALKRRQAQKKNDE